MAECDTTECRPCIIQAKIRRKNCPTEQCRVSVLGALKRVLDSQTCLYANTKSAPTLRSRFNLWILILQLLCSCYRRKFFYVYFILTERYFIYRNDQCFRQASMYILSYERASTAVRKGRFDRINVATWNNTKTKHMCPMYSYFYR